MEQKQFDSLIKELKTIKKLLIANLYTSGVTSENLGRITGMDAGDVRKLVSKRKIRSKQNAEKK